MKSLVSSGHILKPAAKNACEYLDNVWFKYIDDKLNTVIQYLLLGNKANPREEFIEESQQWVISNIIQYNII
jgi:hypothetical protein